MPQPTTTTQAVQVGFQGSDGNPVQADKRLLSFGVEINAEQEYDTFIPAGMKYATIVSITKDWAGGSIDGRMSYDEMTYVFSSVLTRPNASATGGVTTWTFSPSSTDRDDPLLLTIERGSSIVAQRATGVVISEMTLTVDRNGGCTIGGTVLGRRLDVIEEMTQNPTTVSPGPFAIQPTQVDIFIDNSPETLGTTNLCNCNVAELSIGSRFGPWWVLCTDETSYRDVVETQPDVTMTLTMVADAVGLGFLETARLGDEVFIRVQATGPNIGVSNTPHLFQFDFCGKINAVPASGDTDGVVTAGWQFVAVHSGTWGRAMQAKLVNGLPPSAIDPSPALVVATGGTAPVMAMAAPLGEDESVPA